MRLPRPRYTLRLMMLAVTVSGMLMGAEVLRRRSVQFRRMAAYHAAQEAEAREARIGFICGVGESSDPIPSKTSKAEESRRKALEDRQKQADARRALDAKLAAGLPTTQAERREPWYWGLCADEAECEWREAEWYDAHEDRVTYHARVRRRFERAASRPWLSVAEEPEPELRPPARTPPRPPPQ